jgi:hypothetical protein
MTTTTPTSEPTVDGDRLMAFVFRAVGEIGATLNTALVVMGDRRVFAPGDARPTTPAELAERTATDVHYAREWPTPRRGGSSTSTPPPAGTLPAEHAVALARRVQPGVPAGPSSPTAPPATADIIEAARTGGGRG